MTSEDFDPRTNSRRLGLVSVIVGLACLLVGVCGAIDSWWFGFHAKQALATVVALDHRSEKPTDTLEFDVAGQAFRVEARGPFGVLWGPSRGMKSRVSILYLSDDPNNARLADFTARYSMPLILLMLGGIFVPAGWLLCRDLQRLSPNELKRFTDPFRNG